MRTLLHSLSALAFGVGLAGAQQHTAANARTALLIEGVACGYVGNWNGGEGHGQVVVESPGTGGVSKKHLAGVVYSPIVVELDVPPAQPVVDWMNLMLSGSLLRKNVLMQG